MFTKRLPPGDIYTYRSMYIGVIRIGPLMPLQSASLSSNDPRGHYKTCDLLLSSGFIRFFWFVEDFRFKVLLYSCNPSVASSFVLVLLHFSLAFALCP